MVSCIEFYSNCKSDNLQKECRSTAMLTTSWDIVTESSQGREHHTAYNVEHMTFVHADYWIPFHRHIDLYCLTYIYIL